MATTSCNQTLQSVPKLACGMNGTPNCTMHARNNNLPEYYFIPISVGVYLPLLWDPSFCSRSPIALGYTRGHFCALVPPEAASDGVSGGAGAGGAGGGNANEDARATFLPLVTPEEPRQVRMRQAVLRSLDSERLVLCLTQP